MAQNTPPQSPESNNIASHYEIEEPAGTPDSNAKHLKGILLRPGEVPHHKDQELKLDKSTQVKEVFTPNSKYEDKKVEGKRGLVQRRKSGTRLMPKPTPDEDEDEEDEEKKHTAEINSKINKEASPSEPPLPIFTNPQALAAPTQVLLAQSAEAASTPPVEDEKDAAKKKGGLKGMVRKGLGKGSGNPKEVKEAKDKKDDKDKKERDKKDTTKESKEPKDGKEPKEPKEGKELIRDTKEPGRDSKDLVRESKESSRDKEPKEGKDKENNEDKDTKAKSKHDEKEQKKKEKDDKKTKERQGRKRDKRSER